MPRIPLHLCWRVYGGIALAVAALVAFAAWMTVDRRLKFEAFADASIEPPLAIVTAPPLVLTSAPARENTRMDRDLRLAAIEAAGDRFERAKVAKALMPQPGNRPAAGEIPATRRWQLYFVEGLTQAEYARQLDFFEIELGIVGGENIQYLSRLGRAEPVVRTAPALQESRLYLAWHRGPQADADRQFALLAKVPTADKVLVHFLPTKVEERLVDIERRHAGRPVGAILRTRFGVRRQGAGYALYVIDQTPLH